MVFERFQGETRSSLTLPMSGKCFRTDAEANEKPFHSCNSCVLNADLRSSAGSAGARTQTNSPESDRQGAYRAQEDGTFQNGKAAADSVARVTDEDAMRVNRVWTSGLVCRRDSV